VRFPGIDEGDVSRGERNNTVLPVSLLAAGEHEDDLEARVHVLITGEAGRALVSDDDPKQCPGLGVLEDFRPQ